MSRVFVGLSGMALLLALYSVSPTLGWAAMVAAAYNIGKLQHGMSRFPGLA